MIEIKHGNEVLRIVKNADGNFYAVFGVEIDVINAGKVIDKKSNLYEMSLTDEDAEKIANLLSR